MTGVLVRPAAAEAEGPGGHPPPRAGTPGGRGAAAMLLALIAYQGFHHLEHTIETVQLELLGHPHAHTLLSGLDFEWVHFGANAVLWYGLVAVVVGAGRATRDRWRRQHRVGWAALTAAVAVQGYHLVDHGVRLVEYLASGGDEPGGTLTRVVNPVWFHFTMNLAVLATMVAAFCGLRAWRDLRRPALPPS